MQIVDSHHGHVSCPPRLALCWKKIAATFSSAAEWCWKLSAERGKSVILRAKLAKEVL